MMLQLLFEPSCLHLIAGMNIHMLRDGRACIGELMWNFSRNNDDLSSGRLDSFGPYNESKATGLYDENLGIRMGVQRWAATRRRGRHKERYVNIAIVIALELPGSFTR